MRSARRIEPQNAEERHVWEFDLREIDAIPPSFWTKKYLARLGAVLAVIERYTTVGDRIVDLACAQGNVATIVGERGYRTMGVDLRLGFLTYARKKDNRSVVNWIVGDAMVPPIRPESCDAVVLGELLEHVATPGQLLAVAAGLVRPGGIVIATTPNGACFRNVKLPSYARASRDLAALERRQYGPAGADHLFALRPEEMIDLIPQGTELVHMTFAVSALWNRALDVIVPSAIAGRFVETFSSSRTWRRWLCETMVVVLRRTVAGAYRGD